MENQNLWELRYNQLIKTASQTAKERDEAREAAESTQRELNAEVRKRQFVEKQIEEILKAMKEAWIEIQYAESGFAGLALRVCPNDSSVDSVLNRMTEACAKLQPFLNK